MATYIHWKYILTFTTRMDTCSGRMAVFGEGERRKERNGLGELELCLKSAFPQQWRNVYLDQIQQNVSTFKNPSLCYFLFFWTV